MVTWNSTDEYSALIGGILYRNVAAPIVVNDVSVFAFARNSETGTLGISFQIIDENGKRIVVVTNNEVDVLDDSFVLVKGDNRKAVIHKEKGQVILDLKQYFGDDQYEIELSTILIFDGYPIILHPERTKLGCLNDDKAPNISRLTLTTARGNKSGGIRLDNGSIYLLGLSIENFEKGIILNLGDKSEPDRTASSDD